VGRLDAKVAIITGAARGTGEITARLFVEEGAQVVVADVQDERGEAVAKDLGDAAAFVHLDVTDEASWRRAIEACLGRFGALHALVNNAGVLHIAALEDTTLADYDRVIRVNQIGPFLGMRAVAPALRESGGGAIVNVSSVDGLSAKNGIVAYAASKWALRGMTRVAAIEFGKWGIRVNAVCPEAGGPEMIAPYVPEGVDPKQVHGFTQPLLPYQRERSHEDRLRDIARMIAFLASDESRSCTGGDFPVESGNTAGKRVRNAPGA
jgi:3alpha(or 20beta)-hydroxysteroid dehydrogenase